MTSFPVTGSAPIKIGTTDYVFGGLGSGFFNCPQDRIFAFSVTAHATPEVFSYDLDSDGIESLSNLIRSERVLSVVRGIQLEFEMESVVSIAGESQRFEDRLLITRS